MATKTLIDKSNITTSANVEANNLGFASHTNSYRSLKDKPYMEATMFFTENITTSQTTLKDSAMTLTKSCYTTAHPSTKYRAIGTCGFKINGEGSSYCRIQGMKISGNNLTVRVNNKSIKSGARGWGNKLYSGSHTSKVTVTIKVLYTYSDAYLETLKNTDIECSQVKNNQLYFYLGSVPADTYTIKHYNGSAWETITTTEVEKDSNHLLVSGTVSGNPKYYRLNISTT